MGFNRGATAATIDHLRRRLNEVGGGRPVLLVGWSLGGVYGRELARAAPEQVLAVVTLGSPFSGDPKQNNVWRLYEWVAGHKVDEPPIPRVTDKPPVPNLALWSRRDGIVAPRAARGLDHERDKSIEMSCTHMAFAVSKGVARQVVSEIRTFLEEFGLPHESHH
jgi:pimeloyl-ACP methyl ester carboxylesterase